ncbi:hypothetical protein RB195_011203 [Necator americanus]|uniref:Uncharacterized protein n=1 Tax=Necator americanus TaxID=51031 RepID=A0ABR1D1G2_NECAM
MLSQGVRCYHILSEEMDFCLTFCGCPCHANPSYCVNIVVGPSFASLELAKLNEVEHSKVVIDQEGVKRGNAKRLLAARNEQTRQQDNLQLKQNIKPFNNKRFFQLPMKYCVKSLSTGLRMVIKRVLH